MARLLQIFRRKSAKNKNARYTVKYTFFKIVKRKNGNTKKYTVKSKKIVAKKKYSYKR